MSAHDTMLLTVADYAPSLAMPRPRTVYAGAKRVFDCLVAVPALLFMLPLLAAVAVLIKIDSKGPVLFRQTRVGLGGMPFEILKFRTMHVLENGAHIVQAKKDDPRITRIGRFLRTSSLDELPQLINVLKGEMSLVGPRPHALAHDLHYAPLIANYSARRNVKPGLTGWAQVHGLRGETPTVESMSARIDLDVWYAANAGFVLDLLILFETPFVVFNGGSAH